MDGFLNVKIYKNDKTFERIQTVGKNYSCKNFINEYEFLVNAFF